MRHAADAPAHRVKCYQARQSFLRGSAAPFHADAKDRTVSDNGPGFQIADDDRPHIALNNIRPRVEIKCGGTSSHRATAAAPW